jgi:hypothetical protein
MEEKPKEIRFKQARRRLFNDIHGYLSSRNDIDKNNKTKKCARRILNIMDALNVAEPIAKVPV